MDARAAACIERSTSLRFAAILRQRKCASANAINAGIEHKVRAGTPYWSEHMAGWCPYAIPPDSARSGPETRRCATSAAELPLYRNVVESNLEATQNERLVMFSDAVVAITITLLVLDIRLPVGAADLNDADLWRALVATWPRVLGYLISFAVIGAFWLGHQQKFSVIARAARGLMVLNLTFLCCIGLVPFVTGLLAENPGVLATEIYAVVMSACAFMLAMIWLFAMMRGLIDASVSRREQWRNFLLSLLSTAVFLLSISDRDHIIPILQSSLGSCCCR